MATILVVDDLVANREFLLTLLRYVGHVVFEAPDGMAALAIATRESLDLIITDVLMPVMDGYELVRQLRLDPATAGIPVVFCTAHYGEREARELALSSGVSSVLTKPVEPEEVLRVVALVLAGHSDSRETHTADPLPEAFDREHLRLVTDKLSESVDDLRSANMQLRSLINIGLELASERDSNRLLERVCEAARELFGATYVTLGIVDRDELTLRHVTTHGTEASDWIETGDRLSGILVDVVTGRRPFRGTTANGDPTALQLPASHPRIEAYLLGPIASPSYAYGWLCLVRNNGAPFTAVDEQLLVALSGQVGRIYENGYFYTVARERADQLEHQIAKREKVEALLRQERDRIQLYLDTAGVILLALDSRGKVTLINRHGSEMLGWTADELQGRDFIDCCIPPRLRAAMKQRLAEVHLTSTSPGEAPVLTKSGEERLLEWRTTVLRDEDDRVTGTLSSGVNITLRQEAVDALRMAGERMRFALESARIGIWDMDYTTGSLTWSPILEAQYGMAPGSFGGRFEDFLGSIHPEDRDSVLGVVGEAMKTGAEFSLSNRALWTDGTVRWLNGAGRVLLDAGGMPLRGVGISMDVTEKRALEEQYYQAQKMEAIGRLAGGVAHDFNNLLTAILGYCEMLLMDIPAADPRHADINEIHKAGLSAAGLTRQLLAFSRKQLIEPTTLDLNEVVSGIRSIIGRLIGEDVAIVLGLRPALGPIKADRGQVEQIVLNLAVNARDAMPTGGTLTIETANVELDEEYARTHLAVAPGHYVVLTVTDTGTGMTDEVKSRLFEPFFTTKPVGKGTGLGLATIHGIIARSGGSVNVYSELGRGSAFKVYFPRTDAVDTAVTPAASITPHPPANRTVLVVDDDHGVRELARRFLERLGYTVLVASTADQAEATFRARMGIDIMLSDVVMPGASGPELARRLTEIQPGLSVVYMSGYTEETIVHHGVLKPGIAFLHKPFTAEALSRKLREVLDRKG